MIKYLAIIGEIWKLKVSSSTKLLLSVLTLSVGLGVSIWMDTH